MKGYLREKFECLYFETATSESLFDFIFSNSRSVVEEWPLVCYKDQAQLTPNTYGMLLKCNVADGG